MINDSSETVEWYSVISIYYEYTLHVLFQN